MAEKSPKIRRVSEDAPSVFEIHLYKNGGVNLEAFKTHIIENLDGKSFTNPTPFGGEEQDLIIGINGQDVRDLDSAQVKEILRKRRGSKVWKIRVLKRSAPNWTTLLEQQKVSICS